jgi:transposase
MTSYDVIHSINSWSLLICFHLPPFQLTCSAMDLEMRRDLIRCYYASNNSAAAALRHYKMEKQLHHDPCDVSAIRKLVKKFETTFSLLDAPRSGRPSLMESRQDVVLQALEKTQNEFGSTSSTTVSKETGIPQPSVHRILRHHLHLYPYKMQLHQELETQDKVHRQEFATWLLGNHSLIPKILWSDEANIHLNGEINRHNCRIWSTSKPTDTFTTSLHPQKLCVWFGFTSTFCLTPYFFDSTVTSSYLTMLKEHVRPQLAHRHKLSSTLFMQDGAPPHFASVVRDYLYETFTPDRVISRGCMHLWPARSPDINPLDFWFWATLKGRVFHRDTPHTLADLKARIIEECDRFTPDEFAAAVSNLPRRLECLIDAEGGHIEQYL